MGKTENKPAITQVFLAKYIKTGELEETVYKDIDKLSTNIIWKPCLFKQTWFANDKYVMISQGVFIYYVNNLGGGGKSNAYVCWHGGRGVFMKRLLIMLTWGGVSKNLICFTLKAQYALRFQTKCVYF